MLDVCCEDAEGEDVEVPAIHPLTIVANAVLVALAAVPELTSWLQYLPVLAAHSYGY
ncbi:hypothetical protein LPJ67_006580, partial [Coemansia sp. RSA 1938]